MPAPRKYLSPDVIARLRGLELRARGMVAGSLSGAHRSAYRGRSVEFAEHRQYVPGDDTRHVDWRLFGRKDRLYVKEYEEESNLRCYLLLDASQSMAYGGGRSKFEYAATLAASLAWIITQQQDAAGLLVFDHEVRAKLEPRTGRAHLADLVALLESTEPAGHTHLKILFDRLAEELRPHSLVVILSDLLTDAEDLLGGLEHLAFSGHELIVLHVLDDDEWNLPFVEHVRFEGLEDELEMLADPQSLRASYLAAVRRFTRRVEAVCLKHKADYVPINTRDPVESVLSGYLARRGGRRRGAGASQHASRVPGASLP